MAENCFSLAVKTGLAKKITAKDYLMDIEGKTEEEVLSIIAELKPVEVSNG